MTSPGTRCARILVADDEQGIRELYERIFRWSRRTDSSISDPSDLAAGLFEEPAATGAKDFVELVTCRHGKEAVELARAALDQSRPFAVAFLDVRMPPGPDGVQTAAELRALDPHIQIAFACQLAQHVDGFPVDPLLGVIEQ